MKLIRRVTADRWWLPTTGIGLGALALRWYVVLAARPACPTAAAEPGCFLINGDVLYQFTQGRLIGSGHFFKNGLVHQATGRLVESAGDPPLFSLLLGLWSALGLDTVQWQRLGAGLVGAAGVVLIGATARRLGGDWAGWIAAAIAAVHPLLWVNDAMLMSESLYQPAVTAVMLMAVAYADRPTGRLALAVGLAVGAAALVRGEAVLLVGLLLAPLMGLARALPGRDRARHFLIAGVAVAAVMAPWVIYNNLRFAQFVTLTSAPGSVLMAGSCDSVWNGPKLGWWADCFTERGLWDDYEAAFPGISAAGAERAVYDESLVDAFNRRNAFEYIGDNLGRYPAVMLARIGRATDVFRVSDTLRSNWELEGRWRWPSTVGLGLYYALIIPAAAGAVILRKAGRRLTPLLAWWPMVMMTAAATFGLTRYRVPADIAMVVLTGIGLAAVSRRLRPGAAPAPAPEGAG